MKKLVTILFFFFVAYTDTFGQQAMVFKMRYMPELKYTSAMQMSTTMQMDFAGDSAQLKQITANGTDLPIILQNKTATNYTLETKGVNSQKKFSGLIKFTTVENKELLNGKQISNDINPLTGVELNTSFTSEGKIEADSVAMKQHTDSVKILVASVINSVLGQVAFPDKPLKPGDTFSQDIPVAIPITGSPMLLNAHIVYKLIAIQNKIALFDIVQSVTFKAFTAQQGNIELSGHGDGKLFYDVSHNFLKVYQTNLSLKYTMLMGKLTMSGSATMLADYQTIITGY